MTVKIKQSKILHYDNKLTRKILLKFLLKDDNKTFRMKVQVKIITEEIFPIILLFKITVKTSTHAVWTRDLLSTSPLSRMEPFL